MFLSEIAIELFAPLSCVLTSTLLAGKPDIIFVLLSDEFNWRPKVAPLLIHISYSEKKEVLIEMISACKAADY